ncbi:MAG: hypothetical protein JXM68_14040, partial [Sedimentisphaerales bacterium]|nr:hypothetical protein [Sedimentisphaerales bacterium]
ATNDLEGEIVDAEFDLAGLTFADASITSAYNKLGTLTVEGSTLAAINLGNGSAVNAIIVQNDIAAKISVDSLNVVAAATVGGAPVSTTLLDGITQKVNGLSDPAATLADGAFVIPLGSGDVMVMGVASGALLASESSVAITVGDAADTEATVTFAAGALAGLAGVEGGVTIDDVTAAMDLSAIEGAITITGDVSAALIFGDAVSTLAIGGDLTAALTVTELSGGLTITGDASGAITIGNIGGAVSIANGGTVSANITLGDVAGTVTIGDVAADLAVTLGDIDDAVTIGSVALGSTVTLGEIDANTDGGETLTIGGNMFGSLITGEANGTNITITGDFGSEIIVGGDSGVITLTDDAADGIVGSADSVITVMGTLAGITVNGGGLAMTTLMADITVYDSGVLIVGDTNNTILAYAGTFAVGVNDGAGDFGVDTDDSGAVAGTEYAVDVNGVEGAYFGTASYNDVDAEQVFAFTNLVLVDGGAQTITVNGNIGTIAVPGNIYFGDDTGSAITINGALNGSVLVNDGNAATATAMEALGLIADGTVLGTFNGGAAKANTTINFAITAESMGDITVEGEMLFDDIIATDGSIGNITAQDGQINGDTISATDLLGTSLTAGNIGNITSDSDIILTTGITVVDGNLGLIVADGTIWGNITVNETYTFAGIINTNGGYRGTFDVEATIGDIMITGNMDIDDDGAADYTSVNVDDFREDYLFAADALVSLSEDFAMEGYTSAALEDVTITGASTYVTLAFGDLTVYNSVSGSAVVVDETDGGFVTDVIVDGDLAGTITFQGDIDSPGSIVDLTVDGNLSGTFTAQDDIDDLEVRGDWTGSVVLSDSDVYLIGGPNVADIEVWGSVATANLSGATYTEATDKNNIALSAAAPASVTKDAVYLVPNSANDGVGQYVYVTGNGVTATVSSLFGQVSGIELVGKGSTQVISVESDTALEVRDMKAAAKYGQQMIKGREVANDFIDFDNVGTANLPDITVAPRVQITGLTVDGNVGDITDIDSNIKNIFVNGTAQDILAGRGLANGYFGAVGDITAQSITNVDVETNAGTFAASKINKIDIEGTITSATAVSINNLFVGGSVANDLSAAKINKAFVSGNVSILQGAVISNATVGGNIGQLNVQQNYKSKASIIKNSIFADVTGTNIDFDIDDAVVAGSAVVSLNGGYNPVKIINSYIQL